MAIDQKQVRLSDRHLETERGRYIFSRQKKLILDLTSPIIGERVLGIGCGSGNYLKLFQEKKCVVTGIDSSADLLKIARGKLDARVELILGSADDLPFADNEFDIVTLINVLETASDPEKIVAEAIRVSRRRVLIGFLNKYSFACTQQSLKEMFGFSLTENLRFFNVSKIKSLVEKSISNPIAQWGSVMFFPGIIYDFFSELEELMPRQNNPLGAFVGMIFPVKYIYQTVQSPILEPYDLQTEPRGTAPEAVRSMLQEAEK